MTSRFRLGLAGLILIVVGVIGADTFPRVVHAFTVPSDQPYTIGAWYFSAWSSAYDGHILDAGQGLYGRRDIWAGVRDYALKVPDLGVNYSDREPLLGFYDLMRQETMDAHIQQASSRGLSYFAFYWYWDPVRHAESGISTPLKKFTTSTFKSRMKFLLAPSVLGPVTLDEWKTKVIPFMVDNYVRDPSYLTTSDGRPIIIDFGNWFTDSVTYGQAISELRNAVLTRTGKNPFIMFVAQETHSAGDLQANVGILHEDGFTCFTLGPLSPAEPYASTLARWPAFMSKLEPYTHIPCATVGMDPRPWWHIGYGWEFSSPNQMSYNSDIRGELFWQHLQDARAYIDRHVDTTGKMLTIYAWNEWGEGGNIEPSRIRGYVLLDVVQKVFGLQARGGIPTNNPNNAKIVSQQAPQTLRSCESATVSVTVNNAGTGSWTKIGNFKLAPGAPQDTSRWNLRRVMLTDQDVVLPGQNHTFNFTIRAPSEPGTYVFSWQMLRELVAWFGEVSSGTTINVVP